MDPVKSVLRAYSPDEHDLAHGSSTQRVGRKQMPHVGKLVGDPYPASEQDDGAVGIERFVAAVGAFDVTFEGDDSRRGGAG